MNCCKFSVTIANEFEADFTQNEKEIYSLKAFVRWIGYGTNPMYAFIERDRKDGFIPGERVKLLKLLSQLQRRAASR
uniref:Transcriptional regulator n=1 Tax=Haemonchus contortus TaxID=6289 RepID=A0A7I5E6G2_HAECO|nr:unnamed protein product [Haemonchus contortus]